MPKKSGVLFSVHLKATMMKISDPIMFGHFVSVFYKDVFEKHAATFKELGVNPDLGLGDLYAKLKKLPEAKKAEIEADIQAVYAKRPRWRWLIQTRASPICTQVTISSSMHPCRLLFVTPAGCGAPTANFTM